MAEVVPTILATDAADYATRIEHVKPFAKRIHVDISDGVFDPTKTVGLAQVYGIEGAELDLHLMIDDPEASFENIVSLRPSLVIIHFESLGDIRDLIRRIKALDIKVGLAIKKETKVSQVKDLLPEVDHFLDFTGYLGFNGGEFDAECLDKIAEAREINDHLEVGVDGGIDPVAARQAVEAGADVINSGSYLHNASDPAEAYKELQVASSGEVA
jgi:ribulose-phosphate 3-epimerase